MFNKCKSLIFSQGCSLTVEENIWNRGLGNNFIKFKIKSYLEFYLPLLLEVAENKGCFKLGFLECFELPHRGKIKGNYKRLELSKNKNSSRSAIQISCLKRAILVYKFFLIIQVSKIDMDMLKRWELGFFTHCREVILVTLREKSAKVMRCTQGQSGMDEGSRISKQGILSMKNKQAAKQYLKKKPHPKTTKNK